MVRWHLGHVHSFTCLSWWRADPRLSRTHPQSRSLTMYSPLQAVEILKNNGLWSLQGAGSVLLSVLNCGECFPDKKRTWRGAGRCQNSWAMACVALPIVSKGQTTFLPLSLPFPPFLRFYHQQLLRLEPVREHRVVLLLLWWIQNDYFFQD